MNLQHTLWLPCLSATNRVILLILYDWGRGCHVDEHNSSQLRLMSLKHDKKETITLYYFSAGEIYLGFHDAYIFKKFI